MTSRLASLPARLALVAAMGIAATPALAQDDGPKIDTGDTAWMLTSTALVLMMTVPGLALFYAGMVRKKNVLATMMQSFSITALVTVIWMVAGYSLAFGEGGAYIGDLSKLFLSGVAPSWDAPFTLGSGDAAVAFTIPETDGDVALAAVRDLQREMGMADVLYSSHIGKLSLVGAGLRSNPRVAQRMFEALAEAGINIEMISTSEIRISVITGQDVLADAVRAVHSAFRLDADTEAVVYGGTGR